MVSTISLLPGTLIAEMDEDHVTIHVLDGRTQYIAEIEEVESRVARMFRVNINGDR
jgi:multicomponent Na+:H+ antiporter subunit E